MKSSDDQQFHRPAPPPGSTDPEGFRETVLPPVALADRQIEARVLAALPRDFILARQVLPYARDQHGLHVAVAGAQADELHDMLSFLAGGPVVLAAAEPGEISRALARHFGAMAVPADTLTAGHAEENGRWEEAGDPAGEGDAPVIQFVEGLIAGAVRRRASDIHLEPLEQRCRVRYRIDGVLHEVAGPPQPLQPAVVSRLKILANLSIAEKRLPQDGRMRFELSGRRLDLRVSSLPTAHGESVVLRLLDEEKLKLTLPQIGLTPDDQQELVRLITAPDGLVLVTGPTGSGKTTTLYACLSHLNQPGRKIITVEEPVEYQLAGINQVPVSAASGMTFATALRAMLRQAPNLVMVGEIRDGETADIAINASLTGHLVLSTLHTNDAPSAVARLLDLGAKPFLVASGLRAVVAQRLVRRICPACRCSYTPSVRERHVLGLTPGQLAGATFACGAGCAACHGTGFHGRVGIFEMFFANDEIRGLIHGRASAGRLRQCARLSGSRSLREDGLRKVLAGLTTIDEVASVTAAGLS